MKIDLYWAEWCIHCTNFKPTWNKLKEKYGSSVKFADYESSNKQIMKDNDIKGFPTIKINGEEYTGGRRYEDLENAISKNKKGGAKTTIYFYNKLTCPYCQEFKIIWDTYSKTQNKYKLVEIDSNNKKFKKYQKKYCTDPELCKYPGIVVNDKNYRETGLTRPDKVEELEKFFDRLSNTKKTIQSGGSFAQVHKKFIKYRLNIYKLNI